MCTLLFFLLKCSLTLNVYLYMYIYQVSWMDGNSLAQTIKSCLWSQPSIMQTLRRLCNLPLYQSSYGTLVAAHVNLVPRKCDTRYILFRTLSTEPSDRFEGTTANTPEEEVKHIPPHARLMHPYLRLSEEHTIVPPDHQDQLEPGSVEFTTAFALLAYVTASLKTVEMMSFVIENADIFEDEDYYAQRHNFDLCYALPVDEALALLRDAEAMLIRSVRAASENHKTFNNALIDLEEELGHLSLQSTEDSSSDKRGRRRKKKTQTGSNTELVNAAVLQTWTKDNTEKENPRYYQRLAAVLEGFGLTDVRVESLSAHCANGPPPKSAWRSYFEEREEALKNWEEYEEDYSIHTTPFERSSCGEFSLPPTVAPLHESSEQAITTAISLIHRIRLKRTTLIAYHHLYDKTFQRHGAALAAVAQTQIHLERVKATSDGLQWENEHSVDPQRDEYVANAVCAESQTAAFTTEGRSLSIKTDLFDKDIPGFDYSLHKPLLLPSPPRCAPLPTYKGAFNYFEKHLRETAFLCCAKNFCARNSLRESEDFKFVTEYSKDVTMRLAMDTKETSEKCVPIAADMSRGSPLGWSISTVKPEAFYPQSSTTLTEKDGRMHVNFDAVLRLQDMLVNDDANCFVRSFLALILLRLQNVVLSTHSLDVLIQSSLLESGIAYEYLRLEGIQQFFRDLIEPAASNVLYLGFLSHTRRRRRMDAILNHWASVQMRAYDVDDYVIGTIAKHLLRRRAPAKPNKSKRKKGSNEQTDVVDEEGHTVEQEQKCLSEAKENHYQWIFNWTSLTTTKLMLNHIRAGIVDHVFGISELPYAFTYNAYILNVRLNAKKEIIQGQEQLLTYVNEYPKETFDSACTETQAPPMPIPSSVPNRRYRRVDLFQDEVESILSRAITRLLVVSMKARMLPQIHTTSPFSTPAIQFDHRFVDFSPFYSSSPKALTFKEMSSAIALDMPSQRLLADAMQLLSTCKAFLKEMLQLLHDQDSCSCPQILRNTDTVFLYSRYVERQNIEKLNRVAAKNTVFTQVFSKMKELDSADENHEKMSQTRTRITDSWRDEMAAKYEEKYANEENKESKPSLGKFLSSRECQSELRERVSSELGKLTFPQPNHEVVVEFSEHSVYPVMSIRKSPKK